MTTALIIIGIAAGSLCLAMALSIWLARRAHAAQRLSLSEADAAEVAAYIGSLIHAAPRTGQDLPDAMELARLRQQQAAAERLATELASIINSPHSVHLPLGTCGNARYALANWNKAKREVRG